MNLTSRSITAGSWLFSYNVLARLAGILKTAVIARLLVPAQFGVFGIIAITLALLETFSETNFDQVLIQKKGLTEKHLVTSWYVTLLRGLTLSLFLMLAAPTIASFFKQPGIETFIRWAALVPMIKALKNPRAILWQKKLDFKKEFVLRSSGTLAELTIGILVSVITRNVWGLVAAMLANAVGETACSYFLIRPVRISRPSLPIAKELFCFSRW
ncbi:oligosaccharide flippase family protein, partial [Microgenomates group bacterium]|nr:oligosaccharide flippase family protein [Microgenomates group bacterium]